MALSNDYYDINEIDSLDDFLIKTITDHKGESQKALSKLSHHFNRFLSADGFLPPQTQTQLIQFFMPRINTVKSVNSLAFIARVLFNILHFLNTDAVNNLLESLFDQIQLSRNLSRNAIINIYKDIIQFVDTLKGNPQRHPKSTANLIFNFLFSRRPQGEIADTMEENELKAFCFCLKSAAEFLFKADDRFESLFKEKIVYFFQFLSSSTNENNIHVAANYLQNIIQTQIISQEMAVFFMERLEDALSESATFVYTIPLAAIAFQKFAETAVRNKNGSLLAREACPAQVLSILKRLGYIFENGAEDFSHNKICLKTMAATCISTAMKLFDFDIILEAMPLTIPFNQTSGRYWLLDLIKPDTKNQRLSLFTSQLLPLAEEAMSIAAEGNGGLLAKARISNFGLAVFASFPKFCQDPSDLSDFSAITEFYKRKMDEYKEKDSRVATAILNGLAKLAISLLNQRDRMVCEGWDFAPAALTAKRVLTGMVDSMLKSDAEERSVLSLPFSSFAALISDDHYEKTLTFVMTDLGDQLRKECPEQNGRRSHALLHVYSALVDRKLPPNTIQTIRCFIIKYMESPKLISKRIFESLEKIISHQPDFFGGWKQGLIAIIKSKSTALKNKMRFYVKFTLNYNSKYDQEVTDVYFAEVFRAVFKVVRSRGAKTRNAAFTLLRVWGESFDKGKNESIFPSDFSFFDLQKRVIEFYPSVAKLEQCGVVDSIRYLAERFPQSLSRQETHKVIALVGGCLGENPFLSDAKIKRCAKNSHICKQMLLLLQAIAQRRDKELLCPIFPQFMRLFATALELHERDENAAAVRVTIAHLSKLFGKRALQEHLPNFHEYLNKRRHKRNRKQVGSKKNDFDLNMGRSEHVVKEEGVKKSGEYKRIANGLYEDSAGKLVVEETFPVKRTPLVKKEETPKRPLKRNGFKRGFKRGSFSLGKKNGVKKRMASKKLQPYAFVPLDHSKLRRRRPDEKLRDLFKK